MTNRIRKFLALGCFTLALSSSVFAQDLFDLTVKASVPFDFYAGDQKLPAGSYTLKLSDDHRVALRSQETGRTYYMMSKPDNVVSSDQASLTFDVVGGIYLLHSLQDNSVSVKFFESKPLMASAGNRSTVTIAAGY